MLLRNLIVTSLAVALAAATGCYSDATVSGDPAYAYGADPSLEYVSPGVEVVDDLDYPCFFSDGFYWMYDGGFWYRSRNWRGGWVGVGGAYVPFGIRSIRSPLAYAHWHGGAARIGFRGGIRGGYRAPVVAHRSFARPAHVVGRSGRGGHGGGHHH